MSTSRAIIGRKIKQLRKKKKLSQQALADLLHVDRQYAWKLENRKNICELRKNKSPIKNPAHLLNHAGH